MEGTWLGLLDVDVGQTAFFNNCRDAVGDDKLFYLLGLALSHSIGFFGANSLFGLFTWYKGPKEIEKYRFMSGKHPSDQLKWDCMVYVCAWHFLVAPLFPWFLWDYAIAFHPTMMTDPVPGVLTVLCQCVVSYICTDFWFYLGHRTLHWGPLYRGIHKQHHKFNVTIGFAAEYAHPVELILGNVFPVVFACVYFKFHFFTFVVWNFIALVGTSFGHSGLRAGTGFHDFHHSNNTGNFGSLPYWDWILGTDIAWQKHKKALKDKSKNTQDIAASDDEKESSASSDDEQKNISASRGRSKSKSVAASTKNSAAPESPKLNRASTGSKRSASSRKK